MGQTMDQSTPSRSSTQKLPQGKNTAGKGTEKKPSLVDSKATRSADTTIDTLASMAKMATKISPEQRQRMIEEAAYYRAEQRGFCGGDEMQDWLAAESEINSKFPG